MRFQLGQIPVYLLVFTVIASPVVFTDVVDSYFEFPKKTLFTFLLGFILLSLAVKYLRQEISFHLSKLDLAVVLFIFATGVSVVFSQAPVKSIVGSYGEEAPTLLWSLIFALWYGVVRWQTTSTKDLRLWYVAVLSGAILSFLYIFKQILFEPDLPRILFFPTTLHGNQQSSSHMGIYLGIIILMSLTYFYVTVKRWWILGIVFVAFFGLLLTLSRNAWISTMVGMLVLIKLLNIDLKKLTRQIFRQPLIIPVLLTAVFTLGILGYERIRTMLILEPINNSFYIRAHELWSAWKIFLEYPLSGFGSGLAVNFLQKYRWIELANHPVEAIVFSTTAHNFYLELLAGGGVIQFGLFLLLICLAFKIIFKLKQRKEIDYLLAGLIAVFVAILIFYFAYSSTFVTSLFLWLVLGVLATYDNSIYHLRLPGIAVSLLIAFFSLALIFWTVNTLWGNILYTTALKSTSIFNKNQTDPNFESTALLLDQASKADPLYDIYYKVAGRILLVQITFLTQRSSVNLSTLSIYNKAEQKLHKAYSLNKTDPEITSLLAELYLMKAQNDKVSDSYNQAENYIQQAIAIAPTNPEYWNLLGLIKLDRSYLPEAEKAFREVIRIRPNHNQAHYHLGETLKQKGEFAEAIKAYQEIFKYAPGDQFAQQEINRVRMLESSVSGQSSIDYSYTHF